MVRVLLDVTRLPSVEEGPRPRPQERVGSFYQVVVGDRGRPDPDESGLGLGVPKRARSRGRFSGRNDG